jgi:hypothetical protein
MVFMEDVFIPCEECQGKRFKPGILKVKYKGKNIDDCLKMTVEEAYDFFSHVSTLRSKFGILKEVGLGYLQLGQPGFTLSGGEAQRLKIARAAGFKAFGIQYSAGQGMLGRGGECWIGNDSSYNRLGQASNCETSGGRQFGGAWSNAVYEWDRL